MVLTECENLPESGKSCNQIWKNLIPDVLSCSIYDKSFTTFPEALRNYEAERLFTTNALSINFVTFSPLHLAMQSIFALGLLSKSVIKYDMLWPPLIELTEEVSI